MPVALDIQRIHHMGKGIGQVIKLIPVVFVSVYVVNPCGFPIFPQHIQAGLDRAGIGGKLIF